jgi:tetratricopeptide (TPR) repeat protein
MRSSTDIAALTPLSMVPIVLRAEDAVECLTENTFQELLDGTLGMARVRDTQVHLDSCPSCRQLLSMLARGTSAQSGAGPEITGSVSAVESESATPDEMAPGTQVDLGRMADAREALGRAQRVAQRAGDARLAVNVMIELLVVVGARQEHYREAQLLAELVEGALERPELRGDELLRSRLLVVLGSVAVKERRVDRAVEVLRESLAIRRRLLPAISAEVASTEEGLGSALGFKALYSEVRLHYFEALAIRRQLLGDRHPTVASTHDNIGLSYVQDGNPADARPHLLAALAILESIPEHRSYPYVLTNLGHMEGLVGDHERARRDHEAALELRLRQFGPDHRTVGVSLALIGIARREQGDFRQALAFHRRALAVFEKTAGMDHPDYASGLSDIGEDLRRLGRATESLSYQERALKIIRARTPDKDEWVLLHQGLALLDLGRRQEATAALTRAYERADPGAQRAKAAFGLARALDPHRPSSQRARELAQEALTSFTTVRAARERAQVAAYLSRAAR